MLLTFVEGIFLLNVLPGPFICSVENTCFNNEIEFKNLLFLYLNFAVKHYSKQKILWLIHDNSVTTVALTVTVEIQI